MIRRQRRAHVKIWTLLAVLLPLSLVVILAFAPGPAYERAPVRLGPAPAVEEGAG